MRLHLVTVLTLATSLGCGDDDEGPAIGDGGTHTVDGGDTMDAATPPDAGPARDGAPVVTDGGGEDAAVTDASAGDASAGDAGSDGGLVSMPCTAAGACDPFDPTSCPDGESCRPSTVGGTACQAIIASPLAEDEPCATSQDCAPGLLCIDFGSGLTCQQMCPDGSIGACADGKACIGSIGDSCIRVCRPIPEPCDIYAQDCADTDDTCTFARHPETNVPYTGCRPAGTQGHADPCGGSDGTCGHSLVCIRVDGVNTCRYVCDPSDGDPGCTVAGEACTGEARTWMVSFCQ